MVGDVFRRRIEVEFDDGRVERLQVHGQGVLFPDEEVVVPLVFKPHAELFLDDGKVEHAPELVERFRFARALEGDAVVVPVQVSALRFVAADAVSAGDVVVTGGRNHCSLGRRKSVGWN